MAKPARSGALVLAAVLLAPGLWLTCPPVAAQESDGSPPPARNAVYLEGFLLQPDYNDFPLSVSYERTLGGKNVWFLRLGFWPDFDDSFLSFPVTFVRVSHPRANHHLEIGLGPALHMDYYRRESRSRRRPVSNPPWAPRRGKNARILLT